MTEDDAAFVTVVCLANSRKRSERCIAGKDPETGTWFRPVSDRADQAVSGYERQYEGGAEPELLDVLEMALKGHRPAPFQPENWLLDPGWYWTKARRFKPARLPELLDDLPELWTIGHSTKVGRHDRVPEHHVPQARSLAFIRVTDLTIRIVLPGEAFGDLTRRKIRGRFTFNQTTYDFTVTDPIVEDACRTRDVGEYPIGERYLTVSLAEPHEGYAYKLIAAVIRP